MKVISLLIIPRKGEEGDKGFEEEFVYKDMLRMIVRRAPRDGYGFEDIPKANRILRALDEVGDEATLTLEDADHTFLMQRVKDFRWPLSSYSIEDFNSEIIHAKAVKKEKKDEKSTSNPTVSPTHASDSGGE